MRALSAHLQAEADMATRMHQGVTRGSVSASVSQTPREWDGVSFWYVERDVVQSLLQEG